MLDSRCIGLALLGLFPALAQAASITLAWDPASSGGVPTGYIIERKQGAGAYAEIARPAASPYTDTVTAVTSPVCWQARAYNQLATSGPSNEVCLSAPSAPLNMVIVITGQVSGVAKSRVTVTKRRSK
jgi:hypothetical protein